MNDIVGSAALALRVVILYPAAGFIATKSDLVSFSEETGRLVLDLEGGSLTLVGFAAALLATTFGISRLASVK